MRDIRSCFAGIYALRVSRITGGICIGVMCTLGVSMLFYDSMAFAPLILIPVAAIVLGVFGDIRDKNKMQAALEFQELLSHISAALYAGSSLENSFIRAVAILGEQYPSQMILARPLEEGVAKLRLNMPVTQVLQELAVQTGLEDVEHFADIIGVAQRSGGNLIHVIAQAIGHIGDKLKTDREIAAVISGKKTEHSVMCVMPFAMMLYMKLTSPGYFDGLYHTAFGFIFMSMCLCVISLAYMMGRYIVDIKI